MTFASAREAFALGTAPCRPGPCTSIVRTRDRGVSWRALPAPGAPLGEPGITVTGPAGWGIRFATPQDGFVSGNGLWMTTDGGQHWSAAAYPGGSVMSLEITGRQVLAVTMRRGRPATRAGPCSGGRTLTRRALPGRAAPFPVPAPVAVQAPRGLALLCTGQGYAGHTDKTVYVSGNLGATWKLAGRPPSAGDAGVIAAAAPGHLTIAATSAGSWLSSSADNGTTWRTAASYPDGGQGWNDLAFTTAQDGAVIHGHPQYGDTPGQLLLTGNGGQTWHLARFGG